MTHKDIDRIDLAEPQHISTELFVQYVAKKFEGRIALDHIRAIILILIEELIAEVKNGQTITIKNVGKLYLKKASTKHWGKRLYFKVNKDLRKFILAHIDRFGMFENQ